MIDDNTFPLNLRNMDMNGTQETFLLHFQAIGEPPNDGDEDTRPTFMILGTNYFFYSLCTSDTGYGDGTFQKCAPPFKQLFTMHLSRVKLCWRTFGKNN